MITYLWERDAAILVYSLISAQRLIRLVKIEQLDDDIVPCVTNGKDTTKRVEIKIWNTSKIIFTLIILTQDDNVNR